MEKSKTQQQLDWRGMNERFMEGIEKNGSYEKLPGGVFVIYAMKGINDVDVRKPQFDSVVTCHYTGRLINGKQFDSSRETGVPAAFHVRDLISGFQIALTSMHKGDRLTAYIPWMQGYGARKVADIPAYSTLIFDIELIDIK